MRRTLLLLLIGIMACSDRRDLSSREADSLKSGAENGKGVFELISSLKLPDKLDFCGEPVPLEIIEVKQRAEREFYLLLQQPGQIILYLKRSGEFFPLFERLLKDKKLPDDLKFVSVAESALYMSRSPKGATGLWQFMPGTAVQMGLQVDEFIDERLNPEKSADKGLDYLKQGYKSTKSWTLAAAGYNMGHGGLKSSLDYQGAEGFYDLYLNEETSRYILRIVIIKEIMSNPEKYGIKLTPDDLYKPKQVKIIKVSAKIDNLSAWAKENGTTYKDVKLANPWILKRELPKPKPGQVYEIAVPE